jgi:hypothetical protein
MASFIKRLFGGGGGGSLSTPRVPPPQPIPEFEDESVRRLLRRRKGRQDTILTGDLVPQDIGKKTLLG